MIAQIATAAMLALAPQDAAKPYWRCDSVHRSACTDAGCEILTPSGWSVIDLNAMLYSRCDSNGCDSYPFKLSESGKFMTLDMEGRGLMVRMDDQNQFVEVATLGLITFVSHGTCEPTEEQLYY